MTHTGGGIEPLGLDAPRCIPAEHIHVEQCCRAGAAELAAVVARAEKAIAERDVLGAAYDDLEAARLQTMEQRDEARAVLATAGAEALEAAVAEDAITIPDILGYKVPAVAVEDLLARAAALRAAERAEGDRDE